MKSSSPMTRKRAAKACLAVLLICQIPCLAAADKKDSDPSSPKSPLFTFDDVTVIAYRDKLPSSFQNFTAPTLELGVLGQRKFMDIPFHTTTYTVQALESQQARTLFDILSSDSSARFTTSTGHIQEQISIRGLTVLHEDVKFNNMSGLMSHSHIPLEFAERVEVFRGPGSFLNGTVNLSVGGMINIMPKRAGEQDRTTFATDFTSASQKGGHLDLSRRFGKDKAWGIRFNAVLRNGATTTDGQSKKRKMASLALDYRRPNLQASLDAIYSAESFTNGTISNYDLSNGVFPAPDASVNLLKGANGQSQDNIILLRGKYDLNPNWSVYGGIGWLHDRTTGCITGNHARNIQPDGTTTIYGTSQYWWSEGSSAELGLRGHFRTGSIDHQLVLGGNRQSSESSVVSDGLITMNNLYHPLSHLSFLPQPSRPPKTSDSEFSSLFLADTLSWQQDKFQLTIGMRHQNVDTQRFDSKTYKFKNQYTASANTPLIALVAKPWKKPVSVFANYIEGLSPGFVVGSDALNAGEILPPYKSKQYEFGLKWDRKTSTHTLSFFQVEKANRIPHYVTPTTYYMNFGGEQRHRGIEWSFSGKAGKHINFMGGISYLQGELVKSIDPWSKIDNSGHVPSGVPRWMANLTTEWTPPKQPNLSLLFRTVYTSPQYLDDENKTKIPSWIRFDAGASYKSKIGDTPIIYRVNVENLLNRSYWSGSFSNVGYATLGAPRTVKVSATMEF